MKKIYLETIYCDILIILSLEAQIYIIFTNLFEILNFNFLLDYDVLISKFLMI